MPLVFGTYIGDAFAEVLGISHRPIKTVRLVESNAPTMRVEVAFGRENGGEPTVEQFQLTTAQHDAVESKLGW